MTARVKLVPPPPSAPETVRTAQRAVPLVPSSEGDCCTRIADELDLKSRDVARTWLTFLRGLGFVREGQLGFARTRREANRGSIADGLTSGVFGASELVSALGSDPMTAEEGFTVVEGRIPPWERAKDPGWKRTWRTRIEHLLEWLVLVDLADRVGRTESVESPAEGYVNP